MYKQAPEYKGTLEDHILVADGKRSAKTAKNMVIHATNNLYEQEGRTKRFQHGGEYNEKSEDIALPLNC